MAQRSRRLGVLHNGLEQAPLRRLLRQFERYQFSDLDIMPHHCDSDESRMRRCIGTADVLLLDTCLVSHGNLWHYVRTNLNGPCALWAEELDPWTVRRIEALGLRHRFSIVLTPTAGRHSLPNRGRVLPVDCDDSAYRAALALRSMFPTPAQYGENSCPY